MTSLPEPQPGLQAGFAKEGRPLVRVNLRVRGPDGRQRPLAVQAVDVSDATRRAIARGLRVVSVEATAKAVLPAQGRRAPFPLMLFSQELLSLMEAGLNLTEALRTLRAKERQLAARDVLDRVSQALSEGRNFSDVLASQPAHFPEVYVATVRAAERTGDLANALRRYIAYQAQFESIRKKLLSVAIYPMILLIIGGAVTLFLLGYVVPRFSVAYEAAGRDLPWMSAMLLVVGKAIHANAAQVLVGIGSLLALLVWVVRRPQGRQWVIDQVLRLPLVAEQAASFRLARFYRAVSLLLAAGIALPRAMGMVTGLLNADQRARLTRARLAVEQGQSLSQALLGVGLASEVAESLITVGERSGQLSEMLERIARFQDEEFARWIDWASRLLEPVLMAVIGIVVGGVVVLMYMPIFELAGSLQ